jgi:hypothetical protein
MSSQTEQTAELKFVVTDTLIVRDIQRSVALDRGVLAPSVLRHASRHSFRPAMFGSRSKAGGGATEVSLKSWLRLR